MAGVSLALVVSAGGCKNSLNYAPPGGALGCGDPGAICGVGYDDVGDGGPALEASLVDPSALAYDAAGNLYIADRSQNRIRKVDATTGEISTVAGTGEESYAFVPGLPGPESIAASPISVAVTDDGNVWWSDVRTCSIYGVSATSGNAFLAAGNGCTGGGGTLPSDVRFSFDVCSKIRARGNDLVIAATYNNQVRYWNRGSAPTTVAGITVQPGQIQSVAAALDPCDAVVATDGTLFTVDTEYLECRMRKVDPAGALSFIAGNAGCGNGGDGADAFSSQLNYSTGIAYDEPNDAVLVTDNSGRLRVVNLLAGNRTYGTISLSTSGIATLAGQTGYDWLLSDGGPANAQAFRSVPRSPVINPLDGNLALVDPGNGVVREIDLATGNMAVIVGFAGGTTRAEYPNAPSAVAVLPGGDVLMAARNARVWRLSGGSREVFAGTGDPAFSGDGTAAPNAGVWATGLHVDGDGRVFISDARNHRLRLVDPLSGTISTVSGNGNDYVSGDGGPAVNASFDGPYNALVDSSGNLFVADADRIRYINLGVAPIVIAGVTIGPGNIETIAGGNGEDYYGDGGPALDAAIRTNTANTDFATGLVLDGRTLYFSDTLNNRIRRVDLDTGIIDTVVGSATGGLDGVGRPVGLGIHDGYLYWAQVDGNVVKRLALPSGAPEIVAGDGNRGYFGEGVHASQAQFIDPQGLTVGNGYIYVTDGSHRVRRIVP